MAWKVITKPAIEVITLNEAKNHLQIDAFTDDDALINGLITAARESAELFLNRKLIQTTVKEYYPSYFITEQFGESLRLALSPIISVDLIQYVDKDAVTQTLSDTLYQTDLVSEPSHIYKAYNQTLPDVLTGTVNPIVVTYKTGYGDAATDIPLSIKNAMLLMIRDLYDHRDNPVREKMNTAAINLLAKFRVKTY